MPQLAPMQWTMMFIGTWLLLMMAFTSTYFSMKTQIPNKNFMIKSKNYWNLYSSNINKL